MHRRLTGRTVAAVAAATLAIAGCGSSSPDASPAAPDVDTAASGSADSSAPAGADHGSWDVSEMPDPCRTITLPEVAAVIPDPVTGGTRLDSWPPLCTFTMPGPPEGFLYISDDSRASGKDDFARQRTDSPATEEVPGIGDEAYWLPEYSALHVLAGTTHLTVKFAGSSVPGDPKGKALTLARVVLPRATAAPTPSLAATSGG